MARPAIAAAAISLVALAACAHRGEGGASAVLDGGALYRRNCASCHRLMSPSEHDPSKWRLAVERFGGRLTQGEREAIAGFLVRGAAR
jgi:mono/diheme cytochrome c family protein